MDRLYSPCEEVLIRELKIGSKKAFDEIYNLYSKRLYAYCLQYVKSREKTEEIVQDVFLRLWTIRKEVKQTTSLRALLFIISKNYVINAYRANINSPKYEDYIHHIEHLSTGNLHTNIEYDEFVNLVDTVLVKLPTTQQKVLRLSKLEQLRNCEIAKELSLSEQTVKNHLTAGLKVLRKELGRVLSLLLVLLGIYN